MIHRAIFKGQNRYKRYASRLFVPEIYETWEYRRNDEVVLWEGDLENPPLKQGSEIYLHTMNKVVHVDAVVRSTDGSTVYYTNSIVQDICDERTEASKEEAIRYHQDKLEKAGQTVRVEPEEKESFWKRIFG